MLDKIASMFSGGLADTVMNGIKAYFPPDMSEEQKAAINLEIQKIEMQKQMQLNAAIADAEKSINERISQHEGTAKDLMSLPVVGRIIIFARGCQRPAWGFATMFGDYYWMSGKWGVLTETQESALFAINMLVLGFLFGERAVKNVAPFIQQMRK